MKIDYNNPGVVSQLRDAPPNVRKAFLKQIKFLAADLRHPSLHAKKYDESRDFWQARVTKDWRFYL